MLQGRNVLVRDTRILLALGGGPASMTKLMDALGRRYSTVHDTLHRLKRAGLVESVKGEAGSFGRPPLEWRLTDDGVSAKAELILGEGI